MNQLAVGNAVVAKVNGIDGIAGCTLASPNTLPTMSSEFPMAYVYVGEPADEDLSFTQGGVVASAYDVEITVLLGPVDMSYSDAEELKLMMADRFRAAFGQDRTLGGNCFDSKLAGGQNNIDLFREMHIDDYPRFTRKVLVLEHTIKSAAQSG